MAEDIDIHIFKASKQSAGSCSAHHHGWRGQDELYRDVYVVRFCHLEVRLCRDCKDELIRKLKGAK